MKKRIIIAIIVSLFSIYSLSAQLSGSILSLPMLAIKDKIVETSLSEISKAISMKPKGLRFPISKVKFVKSENGLAYEVEGIDNSWTNLFNYGEALYGYAIVNNRLFVVVGLASESLDLHTIFHRFDDQKTFNRANRPPTGIAKNPKWYFEYTAGLLIQTKAEDLDILDK